MAQDDIPLQGEPATFRSQQRLSCPDCGSEIMVVTATPEKHPNQVFRCCGKDMVPGPPPES